MLCSLVYLRRRGAAVDEFHPDLLVKNDSGAVEKFLEFCKSAMNKEDTVPKELVIKLQMVMEQNNCDPV